MKRLKNFDRNLFDLLSEAHKWEYTEINDNRESSAAKKPKCYFTMGQWILLTLSVLIVVLRPSSINVDFAGYIISGLSLFVGLLFTIVVSLFDKFNNIDFKEYNKNVNADLYPKGVRIKNYFKKTIILTLYTALLAIVCILMLSITLLFEIMSDDVDIVEICTNFGMYEGHVLVLSGLLFVYRVILFYFLLNFIYITKQLVTSFFDYMVSEIDNVKLK